jgi:uncharacterized protein
MLSLLPDFADPLRLCALGKVYEGTVPLAELPRLAPLLTSSEGEAAFTLAFRTDAERRPTVRVTVHAKLPLRCQRCLGSMHQEVSSVSVLVVVSGTDEAQRLPDDVDPLLVENAKTDLRSLIEDDLILAIPTAPMHRPEDCNVKLSEINAQQLPERSSTGDQPASPFAALADWKDDRKNQD